jgi:hypothetical protein
LTWAKTDDGIYLATYVYEKYKRPKFWLYNLGNFHPELKEALETARQLIAGKITNHCFLGDRNSAFGEKVLPIYCKMYKEETERKAKLAKDNKEQVTQTFVELKKAAQDGSLLDLLKQEEKDD